MNRSQLVAEIADRGQLHPNIVLGVFDRLEDVIIEQMKAGNTVVITGFVKFAPRDAAARTARNPQDGSTVEVPARRVVSVKPMARLKAQVA